MIEFFILFQGYLAATNEIEEMVSPIPTNVTGLSIIIVGTAIRSNSGALKMPVSINEFVTFSIFIKFDNACNSFNPISDTSKSFA